jgi:predicted XRE-type DNA-binding protein
MKMHGTEPMTNDTRITPASGNVFADMGLEDADELLIKADLAISIAATIKRRGLTQTAAAKVLGIDQPKVSRLIRGDLYGFSIDQLIRLLGVLGQKVSLTIEDAKPTPKAKAAARNKRQPNAA